MARPENPEPLTMFEAVVPVASLIVLVGRTPTSALIPWNSCGAYMAATLGVATFHYLPYAVFNLASPLLAIAVTATGLRVLHAAPQAGATEAPTPLVGGC